MNRPDYKTEGVNRTKIVRVYPFVFTGEVPSKGNRGPRWDRPVPCPVNEKLSVMGQVENFAHEFFGHAYLYAKTRSTTLSEHDYDTEPGTDSNTLLKNRIKRAQNEAASYNR